MLAAGRPARCRAASDRIRRQHARLAEGFSKGNLAKKILRLFTDSIYRKNVGLFGKSLWKRFSTRQPELQRLQKKIGQLGQLLRQYNGPMVLLFGDKDPCWAHFQERVNPMTNWDSAKKLPRRDSFFLRRRSYFLLRAANATND